MCTTQELNIDNLISEVQKREAIWNKFNKGHANRKIIENLWGEICSSMKCEENVLKKKWKYLRDQFSVEFGKIPEPRSRIAADRIFKSKWPYFNSLLFLKNVIKPRISSGNSSKFKENVSNKINIEDKNAPKEEPKNDDEQNNEKELKNLKYENNSIEKQAEKSECQKKQGEKRKSVYNYDSDVLEIEKQKLEYLKNKVKTRSDEENEDIHFFKSLMPHIQKIPPEKKLCFRTRVQELVQQYAYSNPLHSTT